MVSAFFPYSDHGSPAFLRAEDFVPLCFQLLHAGVLATLRSSHAHSDTHTHTLSYTYSKAQCGSFFSSKQKAFTKNDLIGKWTLMYFGFTKCPDECPTTMYQLSKLIKVLRDKDYKLDDKQWVLVSIDPERDTPDMIDKYAKGFDKDFIGVSNSRPMLLSLATQLSVNNVMPDHSNHMDHSHLDNHVNNIILLNPNGDFAGIFRPPFDVARLSLTYQSVTN